MSSAVFPSLFGLGWPVVRSPVWATTVKRGVSGFERRTQLMQQPLYEFTLVANVLGSNLARPGGAADNSLLQLIDFFNSRAGQFDNWLFSDTYTPDASVTAAQFGVGDGSTTAFQLTRTLAAGFVEPIMNLNGTPSIFDNGSLVNPSNYTISATGLVTFTVAPTSGHTLTWTGNYYFRCRFLADQYEFEVFLSARGRIKKLQFVGSLGTKI